MTESPGWMNSTPLIEECMAQSAMISEMDVNASHAFEYGCGIDSEEIARKDVLAVVLETIGVLRRRGLINETGLELIQREMGE